MAAVVDGMVVLAAGTAAVDGVGVAAVGAGGRAWPSDSPYRHSILHLRRHITIRRQLITLGRVTTRHRNMGTLPGITVPEQRRLLRIRAMECLVDWTPTTAARLTSRNAALVDLRLHAAF